jgi:hypothetical protein
MSKVTSSVLRLIIVLINAFTKKRLKATRKMIADSVRSDHRGTNG